MKLIIYSTCSYFFSKFFHTLFSWVERGKEMWRINRNRWKWLEGEKRRGVQLDGRGSKDVGRDRVSMGNSPASSNPNYDKNKSTQTCEYNDGIPHLRNLQTLKLGWENSNTVNEFIVSSSWAESRLQVGLYTGANLRTPWN